MVLSGIRRGPVGWRVAAAPACRLRGLPGARGYRRDGPATSAPPGRGGF